jgi:hypothetical protein
MLPSADIDADEDIDRVMLLSVLHRSFMQSEQMDL